MRADGQGLDGARRILLYGVTGSGKTTLAERLSRLTGIPWTSVDDVTWQPGWVPRPEEDQRAIFTDLCAGETWLLDTAYSGWLDVALDRTDLIVALDYPRWLSLSRLVRRTLARNLDHRPICNGNVETWRQTFSRDSIVVWHFRSFRRKHQRLAAWEADPAMPPVLRIETPRRLQQWLETVAVETRRAS